ncbi:MAG: hypothetical protein VXA09_04545, partial [Burkholderiaceae bacterium]
SQQTDLFGTELDQTLLPEGFHAKTCQQQESRQALTANALDSGASLPVLLARYNRDTQSWKTSQTSLVATADDGLDEFLETWPRSGMTRNGIAYQLPRLAPTTTEIGSGLWPTPTGMTGGEGIAPSHKNGTHGWSLGAAAKDSLTQKPIRLWPTPTANEDAAGTPDGKMQAMLGNHPSLRGTTSEEWSRGTLNPAWVEWLMGFPIGHTDLKH